jgi:hypothetical protein
MHLPGARTRCGVAALQRRQQEAREAYARANPRSVVDDGRYRDVVMTAALARTPRTSSERVTGAGLCRLAQALLDLPFTCHARRNPA